MSFPPSIAGTTDGTFAAGNDSRILGALQEAGGDANAVVAGALAAAMNRPIKSHFSEMTTITDYASYTGILPVAVGGSTVDWQPAFQAAIADVISKGGGRIRLPNTNTNGSQCIYNIGAPIIATADGTINTTGANLHFEGEHGVILQQTQYVTGGQVITPAMTFPAAVNPATSVNVTVGGSVGTLYGYAPGIIINGSDCRINGILFQSLGNPPGTVANVPTAPTILTSGVSYCSGIYHLGGDRPIFEENTFNNFETCIGSQGVNGSTTLQAQDIRVLNNNWGNSYSFGLLIRKFNGLYFCNNTGGGAANSINPNPPHDLYVTDRAQIPYRNVIVIGNNTRNGQQANPLKLRNCASGIIANNRSDNSSGHIQVEYSTDILIVGNFASNMTTQIDSGAAQIRLVDSWRCTVGNNGCSISDNSNSVSTQAILLTSDEKNTGTLTLPAQSFNFIASQTGLVLTLSTALPNGITLFPGMTISGSGITTQTVISGTGLNYNVSQSQTFTNVSCNASGVNGTLSSTLTATFTSTQMNVTSVSGNTLLPGMVLVDSSSTMTTGTTIISQQPTPAITFTGVMSGTNIMTVSNILPNGAILTPGMSLLGGPYNLIISSVQSSTSITMTSSQTFGATNFSTSLPLGGVGLYTVSAAQTIATPLSLTASITTSQIFLPTVNKLYNKSANDPTIVGCSLIPYSGSGAGQTVTILGNSYSATKNTSLGLVTVAPALTTALDATSIVHFYDPTNGHHYISGYKATTTEAVGEGTNVFKINGCDCNVLENLEFSSLSGGVSGQPFYLANAYGNTIIRPRTNHPVTALNAAGIIGNTFELATVNNTVSNTTFIIRPELWANYSTSSINDNGTNTTIVNEATPTMPSLLGITSNITPVPVAGTITSSTSVGSSVAQWNKSYSLQFQSSDPAAGATDVAYFQYNQFVYTGTGAYTFKSSQTTGGLNIDFPIINLQQSGIVAFRVSTGAVSLQNSTTLSAAGKTVINGSGFFQKITVGSLVSAGTGQSTATALTGQTNQITTATNTGGAGFVLPTAVTGLYITVINADVTNAALIYPALGASINALGTNISYSLAAGTSITFNATSGVRWYT